MNVMCNCTVKIAQLIDDILSFSRAGRCEMHLAPIDMNELIHTVFAELKPVLARRTLKFDIKTLESAEGDAAMIRRVWAEGKENEGAIFHFTLLIQEKAHA